VEAHGFEELGQGPCPHRQSHYNILVLIVKYKL